MTNVRISPSFSETNREQTYVSDILLILERKKAEFITKAILFYIANNSIEEIPVSKKAKPFLKEKINEIDSVLGESWKQDFLLKASSETDNQESYTVESKKDIVDNNQVQNNTTKKSKNNTDNNVVDEFVDALDLFL